MLARRFITDLELLVLLAMGCVSGCNISDSPQKTPEQQKQQQGLADLKRQKDDVLYEIQLRQDEVNEMETAAKRPGVVGVSKEWLERHDRLREEIIQLKVKAHDLDQQIADLSVSKKTQ
jgi:hypothetical protein